MYQIRSSLAKKKLYCKAPYPYCVANISLDFYFFFLDVIGVSTNKCLSPTGYHGSDESALLFKDLT